MGPKNADARAQGEMDRNFQKTSDSLLGWLKEFSLQVINSRWNLGSPLRFQKIVETLWFFEKFKQAASVDLVNAFVFSDSESVIIIDYLEKRKTIDGHYYASKLSQVKKSIKSWRTRNLTVDEL